jgi:hypothetical protein
VHWDLKPGNIKLRPDGAVRCLTSDCKSRSKRDPSRDRDGADPHNSPILTRLGAAQLRFDAASNVLGEFWPDLKRKLPRRLVPHQISFRSVPSLSRIEGCGLSSGADGCLQLHRRLSQPPER